MWRYEATLSEGGDEIRVTLRAPRGADLSLERGAPFARDVEVATAAGFAPLPMIADEHGDPILRLPPCPSGGCRLRYRFALAEAARATADITCAEDVGSAVLTSPGAWLAHPDADGDESFELKLTSPRGLVFLAGLLPRDRPFGLPPDTYAARLSDLANPAWAAAGELGLARVTVGEVQLDVASVSGAPDEAVLRPWIEGAARAVRDHFGRAFITRAQIVVVPVRGRGMSFGRTLGNGGATIVAMVGRESALADLASGWELIHELLHVSFPKLAREHAWLEEGMATYVEPLLRARRGLITAEDAFARMLERMPHGLPASDDQGLDHTHTWGRTYWGGAMFCLLADVAIREGTRGARSLDDAFSAVLAAGGNVAERWEIERVLSVGDAATGTRVLRDAYARMAHARVDVDLAALWKKLGVSARGGSVVFDDAAPLAWVRRAMVAKREGTKHESR